MNMSDFDPFYDNGEDKENTPPPHPASLGTPWPQQNSENHSTSDMSSQSTFDSNVENQPPPLPETLPSPPSRESEYITRAQQVPINHVHLPRKYTDNDSDMSSATEYEHGSGAEHESHSLPPLPDFFQFPIIDFNQPLEPPPLPPRPFRRAGTPLNHDVEFHEITYSTPDSPPPVDIDMSDTWSSTEYGRDDEGQPGPLERRPPTPFDHGSDDGVKVYGGLKNGERFPGRSPASDCTSGCASRESQHSLLQIVESSRAVSPELGNEKPTPNEGENSKEAISKAGGDSLPSTKKQEAPAVPTTSNSANSGSETSPFPAMPTLSELLSEYRALTTQINKKRADITFHRSVEKSRIVRYLDVNRLPPQVMSWTDPNLAVLEEIRELGRKKEQLAIIEEQWPGSERNLRRRMAREPTVGYVTQQRVRLCELGKLKGKRGKAVKKIWELRRNANTAATGNEVTPLPAFTGNEAQVNEGHEVVGAETKKMEEVEQRDVEVQSQGLMVGVHEIWKDRQQVFVGREEDSSAKDDGDVALALDADSEMTDPWGLGG